MTALDRLLASEDCPEEIHEYRDLYYRDCYWQKKHTDDLPPKARAALNALAERLERAEWELHCLCIEDVLSELAARYDAEHGA
jgi:hypothetical protein